MEIESIIDNKNFSLWYYPDKKIIHHKFHKYVYGDVLRDYLNIGLDIMKQSGAKKWLSDDRENPTLSSEDIIWGKNVWSAETIEAGWKFWAIILPEAVLGKSNMAQYLKYIANNGVIIKIFHNPEEALVWLDNE